MCIFRVRPVRRPTIVITDPRAFVVESESESESLPDSDVEIDTEPQRLTQDQAESFEIDEPDYEISRRSNQPCKHGSPTTTPTTRLCSTTSNEDAKNYTTVVFGK